MKPAGARPYVASCVFLKRDGNIAMVLRSNTAWMDGYYGLPGGKVEPGESFTQAAVREAEEEAGVTIKPEDLKPVLVNHRKTEDATEAWIDVFFEAEIWEGEVINAEPDRHKTIEWFSPDDLPTNTIPVLHFALEQIKAGKTYCEYGW